MRPYGAAVPTDPLPTPGPSADPGASGARLARGLRVVTRGRDRLQVGLHAGRRVVLPRTPLVERTLADLLDRVPPGADADTRAVLDALEEAGCLHRPRRGPAPVVDVLHTGPVPTELAGAPDPTGAVTLLAASGVRVRAAPGRSRGPRRTPVPVAGPRCDAALVVAWSEPDRDVLDPLLRDDVPHVLVRLVDDGALLGPFVVPGRTACLRCVDAHRSTHDPDHVPVTARYVRASRSVAGGGAAGLADRPADHLRHLAVGWAVRDLLTHVDGARPATWSSTWHLRPAGGAPVVEEWDRHPGCGCSWAADARPSGTMES